MLAAVARRRIEHVSPAGMALLEANGQLPERHGRRLGRTPQRPARIDEVSAYAWLVEWDGATVAGFDAYEDRYDPHTSSDVRDIVCLNGSRRAAYNLLKHIVEDARLRGLRTMGAIDLDNVTLAAILTALGHTATRITYEDVRG
jgi:hypothetical protein